MFAMGFSGCSESSVSGTIVAMAEESSGALRMYGIDVVLLEATSLRLGLGFIGGVDIELLAGGVVTVLNATDREHGILSSPMSNEGTLTFEQPHTGGMNASAIVGGYGIASGMVPHGTFELCACGAYEASTTTSAALMPGGSQTDFMLTSVISIEFEVSGHATRVAITIDASFNVAQPPPPASPDFLPRSPPVPPVPPSPPSVPAPTPPPSPLSPHLNPPPAPLGTSRQQELAFYALFTFRPRTPGDSVFTAESLEEMRRLYTAVVEDPDFGSYCLLVPSPGGDGGLECEAPLTPLQLYYHGGPSASLLNEIDLDVFELDEFENISAAVASLGAAPLFIAEMGGADALVHGCASACGLLNTSSSSRSSSSSATANANANANPNATGASTPLLVCNTITAISELPTDLKVQLAEGLADAWGGDDGTSSSSGSDQEPVRRLLHHSRRRRLESSLSTASDYFLSADLDTLGSCTPYATLWAHNTSAVARIMKLHYLIAQLTLNEWMRPLPISSELSLHDPLTVSRLVGQLIAHPSLSSYAAVPQLYFDNDFSSANLVAAATRFVFRFGHPAPAASPGGFSNGSHSDAQQWAWWWCGGRAPSDGCEGIEKAYADESKWELLAPAYQISNTAWFDNALLQILYPDMVKATIPVGFVGIMLFVQTHSVLLASVGLLTILSSLAASLFAFVAILGGTWISIVAYATIYLALGIGADDIFIATQAWEQSRRGPDNGGSIAQRLTKMLRTGGQAMLTTTLTSCVAFFTSMLLSPIASSKELGFLTGTTLLLEWLLVITLFSAVLVVQEARQSNAQHGLGASARSPESPSQSSADAPTSAATSPTSRLASSRGPRALLREQIHYLLLAPVRRPRATIAFFSLIVAPVTIWNVALIRPDQMPPLFLPHDHPLQRATLDNSDFSSSPLEPLDDVCIVWGLAPAALDQRHVNRMHDKEYSGEPIFDDSFVLDGPAWEHILHACEVLRSSPAVQRAADLQSGGSFPLVWCWVEEFRSYQLSRGRPFPIANASDSSDALLEWLASDADVEAKWGRSIGWRKGSDGSGAAVLSFVSIVAKSKIKKLFPPPAQELVRAHRDWVATIEAINLNAPRSVEYAMQILGEASADLRNKWIQLTMHDSYVRLSVQGLGLGFVTAFLVLLISTRSLAISVIAAACLVQIVGGVLGSMRAINWSLGIVESLCLMIAGGLSVDYVLHIAHAYAQTAGENVEGRAERAEIAVTRMGLPLLAGAMTTLSAAISLTMCTFLLLTKVGTFMVLVSCWAYVVSQTLLPALLATCGPERRFRLNAAGIGRQGKPKEVDMESSVSSASVDTSMSITMEATDEAHYPRVALQVEVDAKAEKPSKPLFVKSSV
jgi:hypothetical protein